MKHLKRFLVAVQFIGLTALTPGCVEVGQTLKNAPSSGGTESFLGEWRSASAVSFPTRESCTDLKWTIDQQTESNISGAFEATCADGVTLTGTAFGVIDVTLQFEATGTASGFGPTPCPFELTGTGTLQLDGSIRMEYTGQTCVGPISGTEVIQR